VNIVKTRKKQIFTLMTAEKFLSFHNTDICTSSEETYFIMLCADSEWFRFSGPTLIITPPSPPLNLKGGREGLKRKVITTRLFTTGKRKGSFLKGGGQGACWGQKVRPRGGDFKIRG